MTAMLDHKSITQDGEEICTCLVSLKNLLQFWVLEHEAMSP
jgi:hypothetical protein